MPVAHKTQIEPIDGTPVKRMFWSIISDYDFKTSISELVDNAIDLWMLAGRAKPLFIDVLLDAERQFISVSDDAGGVKQDELRLLVVPGGSRNDPDAETIGIFGVGGKRAGIALGEQVEIRTRYKRQQSYQLDINKEWLDIDEWEMPVYSIPNIEPGTTRVEVSRLRKPLSEANVSDITVHLQETYAWFLHEDCTIAVNGTPLASIDFDHWAYPEGFAPRAIGFKITLGSEQVEATITAGLITDRNSETENYGVYVYCNHRLIAKEMRTRDVGYYVTGEAGVPHPDASLCRAIVDLQGPAKLMPWNSTKSGINAAHQIFQQLRPPLIQLVSHFSSLSRRLKNEWKETVTSHISGTIETITAETVAAGKKLTLPPLPRVNLKRVEHLKTNNRRILKDSPWTVGLVEAIAAVDIIQKQRFDTKNRIALILLDSDFEIGLKEFIVHRTDLFPPAQYGDTKIAQLFKDRRLVINEVLSKQPIPAALISKANHYYLMRNKLIHERATVGVTDTDVENYRVTVQSVLKILFKLRF
jgi:hypothetical protein